MARLALLSAYATNASAPAKNTSCRLGHVDRRTNPWLCRLVRAPHARSAAGAGEPVHRRSHGPNAAIARPAFGCHDPARTRRPLWRSRFVLGDSYVSYSLPRSGYRAHLTSWNAPPIYSSSAATVTRDARRLPLHAEIPLAPAYPRHAKKPIVSLDLAHLFAFLRRRVVLGPDPMPRCASRVRAVSCAPFWQFLKAHARQCAVARQCA